MKEKIETKFYASCKKCNHKLMVVVQTETIEESMIIFTCSNCKTANFLNSSDISNKQFL